MHVIWIAGINPMTVLDAPRRAANAGITVTIEASDCPPCHRPKSGGPDDQVPAQVPVDVPLLCLASSKAGSDWIMRTAIFHGARSYGLFPGPSDSLMVSLPKIVSKRMMPTLEGWNA